MRTLDAAEMRRTDKPERAGVATGSNSISVYWNPATQMAKRSIGCVYCVSLDHCEATRRDPGQIWQCTRERGHAGDHVACGTFEHHAKRWRNENETTGDKVP